MALMDPSALATYRLNIGEHGYVKGITGVTGDFEPPLHLAMKFEDRHLNLQTEVAGVRKTIAMRAVQERCESDARDDLTHRVGGRQVRITLHYRIPRFITAYKDADAYGETFAYRQSWYADVTVEESDDYDSPFRHVDPEEIKAGVKAQITKALDESLHRMARRGLDALDRNAPGHQLSLPMSEVLYDHVVQKDKWRKERAERERMFGMYPPPTHKEPFVPPPKPQLLPNQGVW